MEALKKGQVGKLVRLIKATGSFASGSIAGVGEYYRKGSISHGNWEKLLRAHCASNGRLTALLTPLLRILRPPRKSASVTGLLGEFSVQEQKSIVSQLRRDGVFIFARRIPAEICDGIEAFARHTPAVTESNRAQRAPLETYDPSHPLSRTYKLREADSVTNPAIQKLMADPAFAAIAESYLNTGTSIGGVDVWWSAVYGNEPGSVAAQLFHFDFDAPPAWLKLFVYATDVGPDNGPHVYVRGSHRADIASAKALRARGYTRISDVEMAAAFGPDAPTSITGPRGTVFMADTRGFHKGTLPTAGHRLIAQLLFCSPVFNEHGVARTIPKIVEPALETSFNKMPRVYDRFR